jgi:Fe2+ or Zn2+ uptake regulation protein
MSNPLFEQTDHRFLEYLRSIGQNGTRHRATILQIFLNNSKPVTAKEVHYQVKAVNFNASFHCVYKTLGLLVKSGLASEITPDDGRARQYTHELAVANCAHKHVVCKDCGTIITGKEER